MEIVEADLTRLFAAFEQADPEVLDREVAGVVAALARGEDSAEILRSASEWHAERGDGVRSLNAAIAALQAMAQGRPDPRVVSDEIERLAEIFARAGDTATAVKLCEILVEHIRACEGPDSIGLIERLNRLAELLETAGEVDRAEDRREEAEGLDAKYRGQLRKPQLGFSEAQSPPVPAPRPMTSPAPPTTQPPPPPPSFPAPLSPKAAAADSNSVADPPPNSIDVYFATHRNIVKTRDVYRRFGGQRSDVLNVGIATVSIPKNRTSGRFILPPAWARRADAVSDDFFILKDVRSFDAAEWIKQIRARAGAARQREILLFVHGYNQSFWQAMLRAAQLGVDLAIDGVTAAYSWPSRGTLWAYAADRAAIDQYAPGLKQLIADLAAPFSGDGKGPRPRLYIIAHSMGCDFTVRALKELKADYDAGRLFASDTPPISDLVLGAPDIDAGGFRLTAPVITPLAERTTVYCSERDLALRASRFAQRYPRVGQRAEALAGLGIDAIDTTAAPGEWLWHADFASSALDDVKAVLWHAVPPARRVFLDRADVVGGVYFGVNEQRLASSEGRAYVGLLEAARRKGDRYVAGVG